MNEHLKRKYRRTFIKQINRKSNNFIKIFISNLSIPNQYITKIILLNLNPITSFERTQSIIYIYIELIESVYRFIPTITHDQKKKQSTINSANSYIMSFIYISSFQRRFLFNEERSSPNLSDLPLCFYFKSSQILRVQRSFNADELHSKFKQSK